MTAAVLPTYDSSLTREHGFAPLRVEGRLPEGLRGTLYRNGPGLFDSHGVRYGHSFEADGAIAAVRFDGSGALGAHRVVESSALAKERAAQKPLFGSRASWPRRIWNGLTGTTKNSANTSVMWHQERLYALFEAGLLTELDPETLATLGESNLGIDGMPSFSAHPHRIPARRTTYGFGQRIGPRNAIEVYALPWSGRATRLVTIPLERPVMLHDAAITEKHIVFFVCPAEIVMWRGLFAIGSFRDFWRWSPARGTEVIVIPIDEPERVVRFGVDSFFTWHVANAFERGAEIVVDLVRYADFTSMDELGAEGIPLQPGRPTRMVIDPERRAASAEPLTDSAGEFPVVDPRHAGRPYEVAFYASESRAGSAIYRLDAAGEHRLSLEAGERPSEVLFVPRSDRAREGEGWALTLVYSARTGTSHLAVLDAERIEDGPIARAFFDHHVPITFHGTFVTQ